LLTLVAAVTMALVGWGLVYVFFGERQPFVAAAPIVSAAATIVFFLRATPSA
jgi:hypothetical protein